MNALEKYILDSSEPEDALLAELVRQTHLRTVHPQMLSGHLQGRLLVMLARMLRPARVLEIGTFTGYSALCLAEGIPDGSTVDTVEADDEYSEISEPFFRRSPAGRKVTRHVGPALDIVPFLGGTFDLVFIDGAKREYPFYYDMLMGDGRFSASGARVRPGAWLLADNVLWYGKAADPAADDPQTLGVKEFNARVAADPRTENFVLPLRDGLNIIRVTRL